MSGPEPTEGQSPGAQEPGRAALREPVEANARADAIDEATDGDGVARFEDIDAAAGQASTGEQSG